MSTGIAYGLFDRVAQDKIPMTTFGYGLASSADGRVWPWVFPLGTTYWDQMAAMIAYLGQKEGGLDKLKGKKIAFLYHDSAYGKEPIPVLDASRRQARLRGDQDSGRAARADAGIAMAADPPGEARLRDLWTYGVMNTIALKTAAKTGYPRDKMLGVWWAGSEEDVIPAGDAAKGYVSAAFSASGTDFPVMQDIKTKVYGAGKGNLEDPTRLGNVMYMRGCPTGSSWSRRFASRRRSTARAR